MILEDADACCFGHPSRIVSKENGRVHIAINEDGRYFVRQYQLDGKLVKNQLCCDYLLLNDDRRQAYYIELKGSDVKHAIEQLLAGEQLCKECLSGYLPFYRVITSKTPTIRQMPLNYRRLMEKVGSKRMICRTREMEEKL